MRGFVLLVCSETTVKFQNHDFGKVVFMCIYGSKDSKKWDPPTLWGPTAGEWKTIDEHTNFKM